MEGEADVDIVEVGVDSVGQGASEVGKVRPGPCSCGARYDELRTGLTFAEVRRMMWVSTDDTTQWRYKRRSGVLGHWHWLKRQLWMSLHAGCE